VGQANECAAELGDPEVCAGADLNIPCWFWWPWRTPNATCTPTVAPQEGEDFECVVNAPPPEFDVTAEQVNGEGLLECEDKSGVIIAGHLDVTIQSHRFGPIWNNRQHCVASGGPGSFSAFAACRAPCDFVTEGTSQWRVIADAVVDLTVGVWKDQDIGGPENFECDPPTE
jgi:hypothetical protein